MALTGDAAEPLPLLGFQDQVRLWLEVWGAAKPELAERARLVADPAVDPWGYLAELGEALAEG